jgi:VCBS repeat-containing protein
VSLVGDDSANETLVEGDTGLEVDGTLSVTDLDRSNTVTAAVSSVAAAGTTAGLGSDDAALLAMLTVNPNVIGGESTEGTISWSFSSGSETFDYLAVGESLVLTYTITVTDSSGATDSQSVTITINGTNDAPVVSIVANDSANEALVEGDAGLAVGGTLSVTDLDRSNTVTAAVSAVAAAGTTAGLGSDDAALLAMLTVNVNVIGGDSTTGTISWNFSSGSETFDYLAAGESLVLTYTITVTDSSGATDTQNVTITINGTNDAPVVSLVGDDRATETLVEGDAGLATDGTLTVTDLDRSNTVTAAVSSVAAAGTTAGLGSNDAALLAMLTVNPNVIGSDSTEGTITWSFSSGSETFDYLAAGESLVLTYTITVTDSSGATDTQNITITINGTNDAPAVSLVGDDRAAETLVESDTGLEVGGTLTVTDLDRSNTVTVSNTAVSTISAAGTTAGLGSDDAALLAMLTVNPNVIGGESTEGTISWSFSSGSETFDYLAAGDSLVLTYTITVTDSSGATDSQSVTITINGTNDAPVVSMVGTDSATETLVEGDAGLAVDGTLTVTDLDRSNAVTAAVSTISATGTTAGLGSDDAALLTMLTVNPNIIGSEATEGTIAWSFNSGSETFDYLAAGESLALTYTITVTDSSGATDTQSVTITINGTNDAPVVSLTGNDSATETLVEGDAGLAVDGTLTVTDLDRSNTVTAAVSTVSAAGTTAGLGSDDTALLAMLTVNANVIGSEATEGTIIWSFSSGSEAFDHLAAGESLVLTYTITVTDSSGATVSQSVTITINGTNDAPVVSLVGDDRATETLVEGDLGLATDGTLTVTDLDRSNTVTAAVSTVSPTGTTAGLGSDDAALLAMLTVDPNVIGGDSTTGMISWSFSSGSETFDYLAAGESLILTYTITVTDSSGATDTQNVTITINGTNDAPAVSLVGDDSANETLVEGDSGLEVDGTLTVTDLDRSNTVTAAVSSVAAAGTTAGLGSDDAALLAMLTVNPNVIGGESTDRYDLLEFQFRKRDVRLPRRRRVAGPHLHHHRHRLLRCD